MGRYEKSIGKKKQALIDAEMAKPFVVGEHVWVYQKDLPKKYSFLSDDSENTKTIPMTIKKIDGDTVILEYDDPGERRTNGDVTIDKSCLNKSLFYIGKNPYKMSSWQDKIHKHSLDNESIMYRLFPEIFSSYRDVTKVNGVEVPETSFDPYVIDKNGNKRYYQRGYVWYLKDKQSLIDSIYAGISCGEIVVRERSWKQVEKEHRDIPDRNATVDDQIRQLEKVAHQHKPGRILRVDPQALDAVVLRAGGIAKHHLDLRQFAPRIRILRFSLQPRLNRGL